MNRFLLMFLAVVAVAVPAFAAEVSVRFPLGRAAYQTNETFTLAVVRSDAADLAAGELTLTLTAADGTKSVFAFPVPAVKAVGGSARATEVLHINGRLLRPGAYKIAVACDGAAAEGAFDLFSHIRMSSFVIGDWGSRASGAEFHKMGEESLGFNMTYGQFRHGQIANVEGTIRGGLDHAQECTQSGTHQMDMRGECDWSDPYVLGGGAMARGTLQAFISRTAPNAVAVHLYDEPGLTWEGKGGPFTVSPQYRSYRSAFGVEPFPFEQIKSGDEEVFAQWSHFMLWHLGFMDAAWKNSQFAISYAQPHLLSLTQSVYGYHAYADGYYFNVVRSLPGISGHGGYSDSWGGYMFPAIHHEYGRMREMNKFNWYLPSWMGMPADQYRLEQYLCFQQSLQGLFKPPDHIIHNVGYLTAGLHNSAQGIVEANKLQLRLGTIFNEMPVSRPTVAVLYSISQNLHGAIADIEAGKIGDAAYLGGGHTRSGSWLAYFAFKQIQVPTLPVVEEDILDGTVAKNHTVLFLANVNYLEPRVLAAVEAYAASGGIVLVSDECKVKIKGSRPVGAALPLDYAAKVMNSWPSTEYWKLVSYESFTEVLTDYRKTLVATLKQCGVEPIVQSDQPTIVASVQGQGDIEYLFLVNATNDAAATFAIQPEDPNARNNYEVLNSRKALDATIAVADDGRPVYDAIHGGPFAGLAKKGGKLEGKLRFGPGGMKVLARTARPIGSVQLLTPTQLSDMTLATDPIRVEIGAIVVDDKGNILTGAIPMEIHVTDPMGVVRYNLLRATSAGMLKLTLPLAANDPVGQWKVTVRELLSGQSASKSFAYTPPKQCGAIASATRRALYFGNDRENIFRFFKIHHNVTIVVGESEYNLAAAERIKKIVEPWNVTCKIVSAKDHAGPRMIPDAALRTWCGLVLGGVNYEAPTAPIHLLVGFNIEGPVILVGNPQDHPMIQFGLQYGFLPYAPEKDVLPGRGRGMIAWTSNMVGFFNQESVMVIAHDAEGMAEAVGTMYEACAGIDPLMAAIPPKTASVQAVKTLPATPKPFTIAWQAVLNDRVIGLKSDGKTTTAVSHDGSEVALDANGKITGSKVIAQKAGETRVADTAKALGGQADITAEQAATFDLLNYIPKKLVKMGDITVVGYWGGLCRAVDAKGNTIAQTLLPNDITSMTAAGDRIIVGLANGAVMALTVK